MGLYSPLVMKALISPDMQVRALSLNVVELLLEQGVVHPIEVIAVKQPLFSWTILDDHLFHSLSHHLWP